MLRIYPLGPESSAPEIAPPEPAEAPKKRTRNDRHNACCGMPYCFHPQPLGLIINPRNKEHQR